MSKPSADETEAIVHAAIRRYLDARHARVGTFVKTDFSLRGTLGL